MRILGLTICFALSACPVSAWEIRAIKDPITSELVTSAAVATTGASLIVACTDGQPQPRLSLEQSIEPTNVAVSYRFDDGRLGQRMAAVSAQGRDLWPWPTEYSAVVWKLRRAKTFHLNIGEASFDFDLSSGEQLPLIIC